MPCFSQAVLLSCRFADLPASALTPEVTKIEATDNQIQEVKAGIAAAVNLEELLLYKNKIKTIDPAIGQLKKLKVLNLFNQVHAARYRSSSVQYSTVLYSAYVRRE